MKLVKDDAVNDLTRAFEKLAKLQNGKKNRLKNPEIFQGTYKQLLEDFNMFLPKGKLIAWKEEDPLLKKKRKVVKFESRIQDLGSKPYTEYCEMLEMLYDRSKTPMEVYRMVAKMFYGRDDLLSEFEKLYGNLLSPFNKKKVKIAIFESEVQGLGSETYEEYSAALEMLETRSKTVAEVYEMVTNLFGKRNDLLFYFKEFYGDLLTDLDKIVPLPSIDDTMADTKVTR